MKKLFALILVFSLLLLSGCGSLAKGIELEETDGYTKITLDNFKGEEKLKIVNNVGEGSLYYKATITSGHLTVHYSEGVLWGTYELFEIDGESTDKGGVYVSSSGKLSIIISAKEATSGEILLVFSQSASPFE